MPTETQNTTDSIIAAHDAYMTPNYLRYPVAMQRGEGCRVWDADGKQYLDLFAGFGGPILGHCHQELVDAVTEQANTLWHVGNLMHTEPQTKAAEALHKHGLGGKSFFCHSGADANESAIKLARRYGLENKGDASGGGDTSGGRFGVITCTKSFHGRSFAAMCATGQDPVHEGFGPLPDGFSYVSFNDLDAIKAAITDTTVAIMLEPIQGEGGVNMPDDDFLPKLRALCDERDLLLICDEVWTGCGRTGKAFAYQHWDIKPDILTLAKGVGGGLPVGVMCCTDELAGLLDPKKVGKVIHATTLGGNCLSTAVTAKIFEVLERDNLIERAAELGERIKDFFRGRFDFVVDIRGKGLFIGVQLDVEHPDAWFDNAGQVVQKAMDAGLLINATQGNTLRLAPALTITDEELAEGLERLEAVLTK